MQHNWRRFVSTMIFMIILTGCGGDSDSVAPSVNVPPPVVQTPTAPAISTQPSATNKLAGEPVTFSVIASGSPPLSYQWQRNGIDIAGANQSTLTIDAVTSNDDGAVFTVKVSNSAGSIMSMSAPLTIHTEAKDTFIGAVPTVSLSNVMPASGDTVTIKVQLAGARTISLAPTGEGCGALRATSGAAAQLEISAVVGNVGSCVIVADVVTASGSTSYTNEFTVVPRSVTAQGMSFKNGVYFASGTFTGNLSNSTLIKKITVPQSLINGGSGLVYLDVEDATISKKAVFKVEGVPGYFVVSGQVETGRLRFEVALAPSFLKDAPGISQRTITAQLIGPDGGLSQPVVANAPFQRVGSGPLQVSLSFDRADDVDLHVITPTPQEIYYHSKSDGSGGSLDLDSNANCIIDNINNENVVWPAGSSIKEGVYKVRVDLFKSCSLAPVNYTVKVVNCGAVTTFTGSFTPADADGGGPGSGREVTQFAYASCNGFSVAGRATYNDYPQTLQGLSATPRELPIRLATVEVRQVADDVLLGKGETDENGEYAIDFKMQTPAKYYVKVIAEQNNSTVRQKVTNDAGAIYTIRSAEFDAAATSRVSTANLFARRDESFAEAFNIFDLGLNAFKEAAARVPTTLPALTWQWTKGGATCGGYASCYQNASNRILVLSTVADEDAYDDTVLAHEFGHFFMQKLSSERSPGGAHRSSSQSDPLLSWSEGAATFFAQQVVRSPQYMDTNAASTFALNIENLPSGIPSGTDNQAISGKVSEAAVAAIMWDLSDGAQDSGTRNGVTAKDVISHADGVFATLLKMPGGTDRAVAGPDLVDFLDIYICSKYAVWEAAAADNFRGLISILNGFPYTTEGKPACSP